MTDLGRLQLQTQQCRVQKYSAAARGQKLEREGIDLGADSIWVGSSSRPNNAGYRSTLLLREVKSWNGKESILALIQYGSAPAPDPTMPGTEVLCCCQRSKAGTGRNRSSSRPNNAGYRSTLLLREVKSWNGKESLLALIQYLKSIKDLGRLQLLTQQCRVQKCSAAVRGQKLEREGIDLGVDSVFTERSHIKDLGRLQLLTQQCRVQKYSAAARGQKLEREGITFGLDSVFKELLTQQCRVQKCSAAVRGQKLEREGIDLGVDSVFTERSRIKDLGRRQLQLNNTAPSGRNDSGPVTETLKCDDVSKSIVKPLAVTLQWPQHLCITVYHA
ncbi:hypothetical protein J6590_018383 [Homalodisca vitripennis]|nr:hypothetical protein J6590_018383 [Homalodisca vitripennis]